ncbi:MAG: nuclear transport factor 2 family protein [Haliscomenobacter sp.]|nr:hypothetical protein [Haliscomenobacter sp.]MBK9489454.1 nuclear transport factor 2 family protein [Haliscomenobacter sp.]
MKSTIQFYLLFAAFMLMASTAKLQAQAQPRYKDMVVENPTAEADMQVVGDYINAIVSGDLAKAKSLLGDKFMLYGPSAADSSNAQKELTSWAENYKTHMNRKVEFITQTFKVLSGNLQGNWVSMWGTYSCTIDGKNIAIPFQSTSRVENVKITRISMYFDNLSVLTKLGYTLTPPKK